MKMCLMGKVDVREIFSNNNLVMSKSVSDPSIPCCVNLCSLIFLLCIITCISLSYFSLFIALFHTMININDRILIWELRVRFNLSIGVGLHGVPEHKFGER